MELSLAARVDQVKVFNLFVFFGGDVARTASAAGCPLKIVEALAHDFSWLDKIKGRNRIDTPEGRKLEQENNRAANYHMSKQLLDMMAAIVTQASENPEAWAKINCVTVDEDGNKTFSGKPLLEIAKAVQVSQDMSYRALGDKMAGRAETTEAVHGDVTNLALSIYAGLTNLSKAAKCVDREVVDIESMARATVGVTDTIETTAR